MTVNANANPQFTRWLTEWRNGAKQVGSKMEYVYNKALRSLREHPNKLNSGQECRQLKGFGEKLCKKIDDKLAEINGVSNDNAGQSGPQTTRDSEITEFMKQKKKRPHNKTPHSPSNPSPVPKVAKKTSNRTYIPSEGSGAYAILLALIRAHLEDSVDSLAKQELQIAAQEFSTTSMTVAQNGSHYSGWHSVKTLINKNLIEKSNHRLASYYLTDSGRQLALKLYQIHNEKQTIGQTSEQTESHPSGHSTDTSDSESIIAEPIRQVSTQSSSTTSNALNDGFCLAADTYEVVLCVDTREQATGVNRDMKKTGLLSLLQQNGVKVEMRTLSVGDFVWIARQAMDFSDNMSAINNRSRKELVLDFVIERKRIDDLAASLKDRRWDEQKYRLMNSGIRKPSYIIEYFGNSKRSEFGGINCDTLDQAITNAQIDGFVVKRCDSFDDTVRYLTLMSRYLTSHYKNKSLYSCSREELIDKQVSDNRFMTFAEFGRNANKVTNFTVSEMFLKHLLKIRGVSVNKAKVIVEHYPTLQSLLDAYSLTDALKDRQNLLSSLKCGLMERNFGPNLSKKICNHYTQSF